MNFKTTSTNVSKNKEMQVCLLLVEEVPWLGDLQNLAPNARTQNLKDNVLKSSHSNNTNLNEYFPIETAGGAFGDRQKSYACPNLSQIWKTGNNSPGSSLSSDYLKLIKSSKKLPYTDKTKSTAFQKELLRFRKNLRVFGEEIELLVNNQYIKDLKIISQEKLDLLKNELLKEHDQINDETAAEQCVKLLLNEVKSINTKKGNLEAVSQLLKTPELQTSFISHMQFEETAEAIQKGLAGKRTRSGDNDNLEIVLPSYSSAVS